jgi:hypothetical protein
MNEWAQSLQMWPSLIESDFQSLGRGSLPECHDFSWQFGFFDEKFASFSGRLFFDGKFLPLATFYEVYKSTIGHFLTQSFFLFLECQCKSDTSAGSWFWISR